MLFGPIRALFSSKFYLKRLLKSAWRAFFFVVYVLVLTIAFSSLFIYFAIGSRIASVVDNMIDHMPEMNITNGIVLVNNNMPLTVEPEGFRNFNILFDTGRTEPVYPTEMKNNNTVILVTANKVYFAFEDKFQETPIPEDVNLNLTRQTLNESKEPVASTALTVILFFIAVYQFIRIPMLFLVAFFVLLILANAMRAETKRGDIFKLACYLQSPLMLVYLITFLIPVPTFIVGLGYLAVCIIYGQIIFNAQKIGLSEEDLIGYPGHTKETEAEEQFADTENQENEDDSKNS